MSKTTIILILLLIIFVVNLYLIKEPLQNHKKSYDCIISINVHEKFEFLLKQLNNIKENVKCNYAVILNCNDYMFGECNANKSKLSENVYVHDKPLNKFPGNGSLMNGIYNNIQYALDNFVFEFFIVSSSRNFFDNQMKIEDLRNLQNQTGHGVGVDKTRSWEEKKDGWRWPNMSHTLLIKHFIDNNQNMYSSAHEGLVFTYKGCQKIVEFLESNPEIKEDVFNANDAMEESGLQTITMNMGEPFYYIGNGCCSNDKIPTNGPSRDILQFMYKTNREAFRNPNTFIGCAI